jgi:hypothetical protein
MKFAVPSKIKPLGTKELAANEAKRDLAAELLQSVREMKARQVAAVSSPVIEARKKADLSQAQFAGQPVTVNEAIDNLSELAGQDILIDGVLSFFFEDTYLTHWPKGERREGYGSSLWISTGSGSLQFDRQACERLSGKRVLIEGTLLQPDPRLGGCGHMSLWPGAILARTLEAA